jgi:site-specific recombinase XerD
LGILISRYTITTHNVEGWREAFREYLESEERSDNTISSYLSGLDAFVKWFEKSQGTSFHPRLVTAINLREYRCKDAHNHDFYPDAARLTFVIAFSTNPTSSA